MLQARLLAKWPLLAPLAIFIGADRLLGLHLLKLLKQLPLLSANLLRYLNSYMNLQQTVQQASAVLPWPTSGNASGNMNMKSPHGTPQPPACSTDQASPGGPHESAAPAVAHPSWT